MFVKFQLMNTGMVILIPVQSFPLNPFFNVFNRWQLPLQFFRQTAGYFIRTDTHRLGHILERIFRYQIIFALTQQQTNRRMVVLLFQNPIYRRKVEIQLSDVFRLEKNLHTRRFQGLLEEVL